MIPSAINNRPVNEFIFLIVTFELSRARGFEQGVLSHVKCAKTKIYESPHFTHERLFETGFHLRIRIFLVVRMNLEKLSFKLFLTLRFVMFKIFDPTMIRSPN